MNKRSISENAGESLLKWCEKTRRKLLSKVSLKNRSNEEFERVTLEKSKILKMDHKDLKEALKKE